MGKTNKDARKYFDSDAPAKKAWSRQKDNFIPKKKVSKPVKREETIEDYAIPNYR